MEADQKHVIAQRSMFWRGKVLLKSFELLKKETQLFQENKIPIWFQLFQVVKQ